MLSQQKAVAQQGRDRVPDLHLMRLSGSPVQLPVYFRFNAAVGMTEITSAMTAIRIPAAQRRRKCFSAGPAATRQGSRSGRLEVLMPGHDRGRQARQPHLLHPAAAAGAQTVMHRDQTKNRARKIVPDAAGLQGKTERRGQNPHPRPRRPAARRPPAGTRKKSAPATAGIQPH